MKKARSHLAIQFKSWLPGQISIPYFCNQYAMVQKITGTVDQLHALTGLRFLAALAIFNVHFLPNIETPIPWLQYVLTSFKDAGIAGVSMFFALSGFILAYSNGSIKINRRELIRFYVGRFSRVYPVYLLAIIVFSPFILWHRFISEDFWQAITKSLLSFFSTVSLTQSWFHPRLAISWNGPGWSLSVEAVFYLVFPFMAEHLRRLSTRGLLVCAGLMFALSLLFSATTPILFDAWQYTDDLVKFHPLFHVPTFVYGMAIGLIYVRTEGRLRLFPYAGELTVVAMAVTAMAAPIIPAAIVHNTLFLPCFALLFISLANGQGIAVRILGNSVMVKLGEASYSLYILQFSIALLLLAARNKFAELDYIVLLDAIRHQSMGSYFSLLAAALVVSLLSYRMIELPCRKTIKRLAERLLHRSASDSKLPSQPIT